MKTLDEIKQEIAIKYGYEYFTHLVTYSTKQGICNAHDEVMQEYAKQFALQWIKVTDRLPEIGLIICYQNNEIYIAFYDGISGIPFTHWMELPEPPEV